MNSSFMTFLLYVLALCYTWGILTIIHGNKGLAIYGLSLLLLLFCLLVDFMLRKEVKKQSVHLIIIWLRAFLMLLFFVLSIKSGSQYSSVLDAGGTRAGSLLCDPRLINLDWPFLPMAHQLFVAGAAACFAYRWWGSYRKMYGLCLCFWISFLIMLCALALLHPITGIILGFPVVLFWLVFLDAYNYYGLEIVKMSLQVLIIIPLMLYSSLSSLPQKNMEE